MSQKSQNSCGCASCAPRTGTPTAPEIEARTALALGEMVRVPNDPVSMEVQLVQAELRYLGSRRDSIPPNLVAPPEPIYRIGATRIYVGTPLPPQLPVDISAFLHNPGIFGIGDPQPWYKVSDPLYPPNNAVGSVLGGVQGSGTGFQISDRHVVTSAHVLAFPDELDKLPGRVLSYNPSGQNAPPAESDFIEIDKYYIPPEYSEPGAWQEWDYAVLTLKEPSPIPFWFGLYAASASTWDSNSSFRYLRGFPTGGCAPANAGGLLWGNGISATRVLNPGNLDRWFVVNAPAAPRMSGGPAFFVANGSAFAVGCIQNDSGPGAGCRAWVTRFDATAVQRILANRY